MPTATDVRQSAVPHETLPGLSRRVSPSHSIMITKGNNIAGEVAYLPRNPSGMLWGTPLRSPSQEQSSALHLPAAGRLSYRDGGGVPNILPQQQSEWDTNTYRQAVNPLQTLESMVCASSISCAQ